MFRLLTPITEITFYSKRMLRKQFIEKAFLINNKNVIWTKVCYSIFNFIWFLFFNFFFRDICFLTTDNLISNSVLLSKLFIHPTLAWKSLYCSSFANCNAFFSNYVTTYWGIPWSHFHITGIHCLSTSRSKPLWIFFHSRVKLAMLAQFFPTF